MASPTHPQILDDSASLPPARVQRQIQRLKSDRAGVRHSAAKALGLMGDNRAFEALCTALGDADKYVRAEVAEALGKIGDPRGVEVLIRVLADRAQDDSVRGPAAAALGQIGDARAVEPLGMAAKEKSFFAHSHATQALVEIGNPQAIALLCGMLQADDVYHRRSTAEAMARSEKGEAQAFEPLCTALRDADFSVRAYAAQALGWIRDVRALEGLCVALKDENHDVRRRAAEALGRIGAIQAAEPLCSALQDEVGTVRTAAIKAIRQLGSPQDLPVSILSLRTYTPAQKLNALQALAAASPRVLRYSFLSVQTFCEEILQLTNIEEDLKREVEAILAELLRRNQAQTLLRAATREADREPTELLRGAFGPSETTPPDELLRASETSSPPKPLPRPGFLTRIFRQH